MGRKGDSAARKGLYWFWDAWMADPGLMRTSFAAQGLWINMLAHAWFQEPRGVLPGDLLELARVMGCKNNTVMAFAKDIEPLIVELEANGVFSRGKEMNDSLPENAVVNRRMWREWQEEMGRVEQARNAANIGWMKRKGGMLNDAQGYADRECSSDAQRVRVTGGKKEGYKESGMLNACSSKMLSGCHSPTLTLNRGRSSTVDRPVGGVGEGATGQVFAERIAALEALPGLDAESKRTMLKDLRRRYADGGNPSEADATVGPTAQRLRADVASALEASNPEAGEGTGKPWRPARQHQRKLLVKRCVSVTGDGASRRNWWKLIDVLCQTQDGETRLLDVIVEFEDRMRRRDPADAKPDRPGAVLNSRLRAVIEELNLQPRRKGK